VPRIKSYTHNTNLKLLYEHVALLNSKAAEETRPTDLAMAADGSVLYTLSGGEHRIGVYKIQRGATLQKLESLDVLPIGVTGLIVR